MKEFGKIRRTLIAKAIILAKMGQGQQAIIWIDKPLQVNPKNAKALEMKKEISESIK